MKILYMTMSYDPNRNGLYQNLVDSLLEKNHEITIVRSKNDIDKNKVETIKNNLKILSVKTGDPFSKNIFKKGMNQILLATYFKNAIKEFLSNENFDLILYATPPVTLASVVQFCKNKYHAKTFLMLKDIFPQNAVDLGMMKKNGLIYKYFRGQEKKYYDLSDKIGCMSQGNVDYVIKHNPDVDKNKLLVFPNSICIEEVDGLTFHEDKTVFLFGGNIGKPQNVSGILNIIDKLNDYPKAEFVFVGKGVEQNKIINYIKENEPKNVKYLDYLPQKEYYNLLKSADVGLISLDPRFTIPNIPSKFQHYLKLKKPVLAITDVNTDLKNMIKNGNCGWWCDAENSSEIVKTIKYICNNKNHQISRGENSFKYLEKFFNVKNNVEILERLFN